MNLLHLFLACAAATYALMFLQHLTKSRVVGLLAGLMSLPTVVLLAALITGGTALVAAGVGAGVGLVLAVCGLVRDRSALSANLAEAVATPIVFCAFIGMAGAVVLSLFS